MCWIPPECSYILLSLTTEYFVLTETVQVRFMSVTLLPTSLLADVTLSLMPLGQSGGDRTGVL